MTMVRMANVNTLGSRIVGSI